MKNIETIIEALLFVKTEPMPVKKLAQILKISEGEAREGLGMLKKNLVGRGILLVENGDEVMLGTAPEASGVIEEILKEELSRDLGKAGLETISIILYKAPVLKSEIDFIRGVNSQFILRNLLIRGLVERIPNPKGRGSLYQPTMELLRYMAVPSVKDLPDYEKINESLNNYKAGADKEEENEPLSGNSE